MSEIPVAVEGAVCQCQYGNIPDKIKVLSHKKEFANDGKLIVSTMEIGAATLEKNCFGKCPLMGTPSPPCKPVITEWQDYYDAVQLSNGGCIVLETSKAVCAISGTPCIEITNNGQIEEPCEQNFDNVNDEVQSQLNPLVDVNEMRLPEQKYEGIVI